MQFLGLLALIPAVLALDLTIAIPATQRLPNPSVLPSTTHITLHSSGNPHITWLTRRNTFEFRNLTPGSYLATIHCRDYSFEPLRVDVTKDVVGDGEKVQVWQTFRGNEWDNKGEKRGEGGSGTVVNVGVVGQKDYYMQRQGFSPMSFLKNPMILMAIVSMGMIFGMPYLMDNMDPETKAEMEEMRNEGVLKNVGAASDTAQQIQNFDLASWMAGKTPSTASSGTTERKRK